MRNYHAEVSYLAKGDRYPLDAKYRISASSAATAAQRAMNLTKKEWRFREKENSVVTIKITIGRRHDQDHE